MMEPRTPAAATQAERWKIVVDSIGEADASLLGVLSEVLPFPESHLANLLYQAPSELLVGLDHAQAAQVNGLLLQAGLESRVLPASAAQPCGDARHEVALVLRDVRRAAEVVALIERVLGVSAGTATKLLCSSPAVLLGRISANTAQALRQRFEALGCEVDVSDSAEAVFDLFCGAVEPADRSRVLRSLQSLGAALPEAPEGDLLVAGLTRDQADSLWGQLHAVHPHLRMLNRAFERFDLRLDGAQDSAELRAYLVAATGMPPAVAPKVIAGAPMVILQSVPFEEMRRAMSRIGQLGGVASAHLVAFQGFALEVRAVAEVEPAVPIVQALAGLSAEEARQALRAGGRIPGPLSSFAAQWLSWELKRVGATTQRALR